MRRSSDGSGPIRELRCFHTVKWQREENPSGGRMLLPLLVALSAEGTSGSSYSITLLSTHWLAALRQYSTYTHFSSTTRAHKPQTPTKSVGLNSTCRHLGQEVTSGKSGCRYLLVALAPGPTQAFESVHRHLARFLSSRQVPQVAAHVVRLSVTLPSSAAARRLSLLSFWNDLIRPPPPPPPRQKQRGASAAGPAGRTYVRTQVARAGNYTPPPPVLAPSPSPRPHRPRLDRVMSPAVM